jgi:phosphatidylglycerophosphate synthase
MIPARQIKTKVATILADMGVSANFVTYLGLATALVAGAYIFTGQFFIAGHLILLSGVLDILDGAIARLNKDLHYFGGILDSSLDRYGDGFLLGGVILYFALDDNVLYSLLGLSALLAGFNVSYVRARAECEIESCRVGFWERGERVVYLALALILILDNLSGGLWVLATVPHLTAIYRLCYAYNPGIAASAHLPAKKFSIKRFFLDTRRGTRLYPVKVVFWVLLLILWRPSF